MHALTKTRFRLPRWVEVAGKGGKGERGGEGMVQDEAEEEAQREAANANTKQDQSCETDTQCDTNCLKTSPTLNLIWGFVDVTLGRL